MRKVLLVLPLFFGCMMQTEDSIDSIQSGLHSWSTYHWSSNNLSPSVSDKTRSSVWVGLTEASLGTWTTLVTPLQPVLTSKVKSDVVVQEGFSTSWLGLAQVWVEDGHITRGKVLLNTTYLFGDSRFTENAAVHVLCQELGHVWGLDHNHDDLDTCMNDCLMATTELEWLSCLNSDEGTTPNNHDMEQLNLIYSHEDASSGSDCSRRPNNPRCLRTQGTWVTVSTTPLLF